MRPWICAWLLACVLGFTPGRSCAADQVVQALAETFRSDLPIGWHHEQGGWDIFDVAKCFEANDNCYASNPSSPYGFLTFDEVALVGLAPNEAMVIFMRLPPEVRYFGFTQYLAYRGATETVLIASLSDTLNLLDFSSLHSPAAGQDLFNKPAVLVWTADMNTFDVVKATLAQQGIDASQINFLPIPIGLPLNMGYELTDDAFTLVMRTALPRDQERFNAYLDDRPFYVVKTGPPAAQPVAPAPMIGFAEERTGVSEGEALASALNTLVDDILSNYKARFKFERQEVRFPGKSGNGWDCIKVNVYCSFDNHDALYSTDTSRPVLVRQATDIVIVAGVNHQSTGKAIYMNHAVHDAETNTGIVAIDDSKLSRGSALYHAGVRLPRDPRVELFRNLYAYAIAFDCGKLRFCIEIPRPTAENPVGLNPDEAFMVYGRSYVEPRTGVHPALTEMVQHQVYLGTAR